MEKAKRADMRGCQQQEHVVGPRCDTCSRIQSVRNGDSIEPVPTGQLPAELNPLGLGARRTDCLVSWYSLFPPCFRVLASPGLPAWSLQGPLTLSLLRLWELVRDTKSTNLHAHVAV